MAESLDIALNSEPTIRGQLTRNDRGQLEQPEHIIKNLTAARAVYFKYRQEHLKRISLYAAIEGLIAGNPPYNPIDLQRSGLAHIANFNTLDGRSLYERSALAYWNLLNEAEYIAKFTILSDDPEARRAEDIMSVEFDRIIRKWPSFQTQMNTMSGQLIKFGVSPVLWPDERDWRWRTVELSKFFIADQAQCDIEMITSVCVESNFTAQYLFEVYEEYKDLKGEAKKKCPWDTDALQEILFSLANTFAKTTHAFIDFFDLQKRLQNGDVSYDAIFTDSIPLVSLFYKEYDGKFSHYMFHRTYGVQGFLYSVDRQYESLQEALVLFTASPGEYTIHSNRGIGHRIFSICQAIMMNDCSTVDGARWASTPLIKGVSLTSNDPQQIRFYPGVPTNIGTADIVPNNMGANLQQQVYVSQYLMQKMMFNTSNSGDDPGTPDRNQGSISPTQAKMKSFKEFSVLKNNVAHFYDKFDVVISGMVIKMLKSKAGYPAYEWVKLWKDRCIAQGVPEMIFKMDKLTPWGMPQGLDVKASRVAGDGSTLARLMGLEILGPLVGDFGPREAKEYKRQYIMAALGKEQVGSFMQNADDADNEAGGASLAGVENGIMQLGKSPVFSPDNDHKAHFATHMALSMQTIQALQQQQTTPVEADKIFSVIVPHISEHFAAAARSPFAQTFVAQQKKGLDQLIQYATLNKKNAASMIQAQIKQEQEAQAQQQKVMSDEELKNLKAQGDEKRADFKVQSQVARADKANETRAEVQKDKINKDADNQRYKIQLEHSNKSIEISNKQEQAMQSERLDNLRQQLQDMNGTTVAPNDIEGIVR